MRQTLFVFQYAAAETSVLHFDAIRIVHGSTCVKGAGHPLTFVQMCCIAFDHGAHDVLVYALNGCTGVKRGMGEPVCLPS